MVGITQFSSVTGKAIDEEVLENVGGRGGLRGAPEEKRSPAQLSSPPSPVAAANTTPEPKKPALFDVPAREPTKLDCSLDIVEDVPAGGEFDVVLHGKPAESKTLALGLGLLLVEGNILVVGSVMSGASAVWNESNPSKRIRPCDRIVAVNGFREIPDMVRRTKDDSVLAMTLRRSLQFSVSITKPPDSPSLGLRCSHDDASVMVAQVIDGPFKDWNAANPGRKILPQDRIFEVNGVQDSAESILSTMQESPTLDLKILRAM